MAPRVAPKAVSANAFVPRTLPIPTNPPKNFETNAKMGVKLILKSDFTSQNTVRERGLGGGASLSDYSETCSCWLTASRVPCQSAHIVSWLSLGFGLGNRWCKYCSPRAWAFVGANTCLELERILGACPSRGHAKPCSQSTLGTR